MDGVSKQRCNGAAGGRRRAPFRPGLGWLAIVLGLFVAGPVVAQGAATNTTATLIYYDAVGNETLDPAETQSQSSFSQEVFLALFDTLVRLDAAGNPKPGLAESWRIGDGLTTLTLSLRRGVRFHDGAELTAEVVKRNMERIIALGTRTSGTMVEAFRSVATIEILGAHELKLMLKNPNGQMLYHFGSIAGMVASPASLTEGAYGANFKPIGTGPYRLKSFESNVRTVLSRNDDYWAGPQGRPAGFEHHYVPDGRARLNALRSGQANIALIEPRQIAEAKGAGLQVQINEKNSVWDIYVNLSRPQLGNLKFRQAMMHAIDRQALAEALSFGSGTPTVQFFARSSPVYDPALENRYPYDPAKARALLAEAGFKDGAEVAHLLLNTTEYRTLAEALQAMLAEVGIKLKFDVVDASQFVVFRRPPTRADILMARWGGRPDPLQVFQELVSTGGSFNPVSVATPEIDQLIEKARGMVPDDPERLKLLRAIAKVSVEFVANIPLMSRSNVYAYRPGCISGLDPYLPQGDDRFNDVKMAPGCK